MNPQPRIAAALIALSLLSLVGCGGETSENTDAGRDSGTIIPKVDAGVDAGEQDAGVIEEDAGTDAGIEEDAGVVDAGPDTSAQLVAARAAADTGAVALDVQGALVTYVKPPIGTDPEGFFLQAEQTGPAIFVQMDGGTLASAPAVGDVVDLQVNEVVTITGTRNVTQFTGYTKVSGGNPVSSLIQNITTATDVVSALDSYESELVSVTGTLVTNMANAGTGYVGADLNTAGINGNPDLELRTPTTVRDALDLAQGCEVKVNGTPMWRYNTRAQISAWTNEDVTVLNCPAPKLLSASAMSTTSVDLVFDRQIAPTSVLPTAFSIDNGLTVVAATVTGKTVTLTTSLQSPGTAYTVTVATTVTDTYGRAIDAAANSDTFNGFVAPAQVIITEINPNISGGLDLIELQVVSAGSMNNIKVEQIGTTTVTTMGTLPDVIVQTGDIIVVHTTVTAGTEITAKNQIPTSATPSYFDTAWDVQGNSSGMSATNDRILRVVKPDGTVMDEVPFGLATATPSTQFLAELQVATTTGQWTPACAANPCNAADATNLYVDWSGLTTSANSSMYKLTALNTNSKADWLKADGTTVTATFGLPNP